MLNIRVINPGADPSVVEDFYAGQTQVYSEFAAEKAAIRLLPEDIEAGSVYLVIGQDAHTGEMAGGLRLYLRPPGIKLPVERVLADNHSLHVQLLQRSRKGIAEISGFWAHSRWRGTGLGSALVRVAIAAMPLLGAEQGIAFSHHHMRSLVTPIGWVFDPEAGRIPYPDARYDSSVIWIDPITLRNAEPAQRALIFDLRATLRRRGEIQWSLAHGEMSGEQMHMEARSH